MMRCYDMSRLFYDCLALHINGAGGSERRWLHILQGGSAVVLVQLGPYWHGILRYFYVDMNA